MNKAHISIREHIHWDPSSGGDPSEPTSTIVLTSPAKRFVDIRVLRSDADPTFPVKSKHGSLDALDWAFAGTSSVLRSPVPGDDSEVVEWSHWIDSRNLGPGAEPGRDVGRCYPLPNGDTLEKGSMAHPDSGRVTEYEELWGSIEIEGIADAPGEEEEKKVAAVLQADDTSSDSEDASEATRGTVVRVGQFIQGIVARGGRVAVERWHHGAKGWDLHIRLGSAELEMPCALLFDASGLAEGDDVTDRGRTWRVLEKKVLADV